MPEPRVRGADGPPVLHIPGFSEKLRACVEPGRAREARLEAVKPPITRVLPTARVVILAGEPRACIELQLKDVAELQTWLEEQQPHPLSGIPPAWADPEPETRKQRLFAAWTAAKSWPVRYGSREGAELLAGPAGRAFTLWVCLRKLDPGFTLAGAWALLPGVSPTEWSGLMRVAFGVLPQHEILAELEAGDDGEPWRLTDWCEAFNLVHEHRGLDYAGMGELYLSQWRNINRAGKPAAAFTPRPGESPARAAERARALWADVTPEAEAPAGAGGEAGDGD